jgi:hypothetical protein
MGLIVTIFVDVSNECWPSKCPATNPARKGGTTNVANCQQQTTLTWLGCFAHHLQDIQQFAAILGHVPSPSAAEWQCLCRPSWQAPCSRLVVRRWCYLLLLLLLLLPCSAPIAALPRATVVRRAVSSCLFFVRGGLSSCLGESLRRTTLPLHARYQHTCHRPGAASTSSTGSSCGYYQLLLYGLYFAP